MAISKQSPLTITWLRKLNKKHFLTVAAGVALIFLSFSFLFNSQNNFLFNSNYVPLTLVQNAKDRGAFCLDGSLPGYHFQKGFGSGSSNWVLHIEGGGWCDSIETCSLRKTTALGSSNHMEQRVQFTGILSQNPARNPDFFNWNKVKIRYCDGSSFAGHPENEFHNGTRLFFRGKLIWDAVMAELLAKGMSSARQGASKSMPSDCVVKMDPSLCFFPQQLIRSISTPLFLVNPAYDFWQVQHVLVPAASDIPGEWQECRLNIQNCNPHQLDILQGFRKSLLNALSEFKRNKEGGVFINSCFIHCQTWLETWHGPNSPKLNHKTIAETVGDWYFDKEHAKRIDCPFPCNPSCFNMDFT